MTRKGEHNLLEEVVGGVVDGVDHAARMVVTSVGKVFLAPIELAGTLLPKPGHARRPKPGSAPGIEHMPEINQPPKPDLVVVTCCDYGPEQFEKRRVKVADLPAFLKADRPDWAKVRWVNVDGLHPYVVNQFKQHFKLHALAAEDVLHPPQRPKIDDYDGSLFIVARMVMMREQHLHTEQTSFFLVGDTLITFQETHGDVWDAVRDRIEVPKLRLRHAGPDYLLYALLDALVDSGFPLLEAYSDELDQLEGPIINNPRPSLLRRVHRIKRELAILRRVLWPMRDVIDELYRGELEEIAEDTKAFMRDVYGHNAQVLDIIETYREMSTGLGDLYMNAVSNRMNEVMKVLTVMASLFIPISFVAGMWGMNVAVPGQDAPNGFWYITGACGTIIVGLLIYFKRRRWI